MLLQAGWAASLDGDVEGASRAIHRAVERAPNDADVLAVAAWSGPGAGGIYAEANAWADRALALNPAAPGWYLMAKGTAAFGAGDYRAAVEAFRAAPPGFAERAFFLAAAHGMLGDEDAARAATEELRAMLPGFDPIATCAPGTRPPSGNACAMAPRAPGSEKRAAAAAREGRHGLVRHGLPPLRGGADPPGARPPRPGADAPVEPRGRPRLRPRKLDRTSRSRASRAAACSGSTARPT